MEFNNKLIKIFRTYGMFLEWFCEYRSRQYYEKHPIKFEDYEEKIRDINRDYEDFLYCKNEDELLKTFDKKIAKITNADQYLNNNNQETDKSLFLLKIKEEILETYNEAKKLFYDDLKKRI